jgi:ATP-dependent DNA helicase RecQ
MGSVSAAKAKAVSSAKAAKDAPLKEMVADEPAVLEAASIVNRSQEPITKGTNDPSARLKSDFGLERFQPGQLEVITRLLEGRSAAAVFPTGGGKSLCYQLPSQMLPGATIVISPLIALMKDQCDSLARRGIAAARLDSTMSASEVAETMRGVRNGSIKMLYVAPERFFNERFRASISELRISLFAVDEAHCISRWGHNFRPDYLKLAELARTLQAERVLALTATATPSVLQDICEAFSIEAHDAIRTPFFRPNLQLRSRVVKIAQRDEVLWNAIKGRPLGATIVYVTLQKTAEAVADFLVSKGLPAKPYHAGMDDDVRASTQAWFNSSPDGIVVATIAFGMGIDKSDIRYVYHYNPPASLEAYAQEIGRAGRDGKDSLCELMLVPDDRIILENFAFGDTPTRHAVGKLIDLIAGQSDLFHISHYQLSAETDIRILVARTLLTYLELDGYITGKSPRYDTYKIKPLVASSVILSHFTGERKDFIGGMLSCLTKGRTWFLLNMAVASKRLGCERDRLVKAVEYLAEKNWIEVEVSDLVHGYQKTRPITEPKLLADQIYERLEQRERDEVARLDGVFGLAKATDCMAGRLSHHFGEKLAKPCGRCSGCNGEGPYEIGPAAAKSIGTSAKTAVMNLAKKYPDQLSQPRERARFLCGLTSPGFTRSRLTRDPSFGICDSVPYPIVFDAMKAMASKK